VPDKLDKRTKPLVTGLGEELRRRREDLGVPQIQLAKTIKMEATNLAKIERGEKNVTVDTLRRIAEGLGLDLVIRFTERSASGDEAAPTLAKRRRPDKS
jgi:transcriptional regulator with XRE-family HTH domain